MTCGCGPFQPDGAASVGLAECSQSLSDKLVLLQHLGDGPKNRKLGLTKTGERNFEERKLARKRKRE